MPVFTLLKFLGHFLVCRVCSLKIWVVVAQIFKIWVTTTQFFRE